MYVIRLQPHRIWNSHSLADWIHTYTILSLSSPLSLFSVVALSLSFSFLVSLFLTTPNVHLYDKFFLFTLHFPIHLGRFLPIIRYLPSPLASRAALLQSWNHLVKQPAKATLMLRLDKDSRIPTISGLRLGTNKTKVPNQRP